MIDIKPDISNIITVKENHQNTEDSRAKTPPIVVCPTKTLNLYSCTMVRKFHKYFVTLDTKYQSRAIIETQIYSF